MENDVKEALELYEIMDKYGCDMDVAEIMLQDEKEENQ